MPDWETELAVLLRALGVSLDPEPEPSPDERTSAAQPPATHPMIPVDPDEASVVPFDAPGDVLPTDAGEDDEVTAVRREIEATLARVVHLTRAGQLDRDLRDDVVFVLQALTRPGPATLHESEHTEWQIASAAAVLHFCRVVLRLTRPLGSGTET